MITATSSSDAGGGVRDVFSCAITAQDQRTGTNTERGQTKKRIVKEPLVLHIVERGGNLFSPPDQTIRGALLSIALGSLRLSDSTNKLPVLCCCCDSSPMLIPPFFFNEIRPQRVYLIFCFH